ncbi:hypothetical protein [Aquibium sp. ELW1220]|uniref:hypothetical protein n=1 Tax=Aquibium sp. ELW1220 TaxID=2976766 RepID=UPI0025B22C17|nr:hypothetical protein [Aquibium sp. ELW1220]MDN2584258.1 hypothetical protein [Aquibium sp. ELW1220]
MTENEERPETKAESTNNVRRAEEPNNTGDASPDDLVIPPTLVGYFSEDRATPSAFFKVLRKNEVKRFRAADQEAAAKLMTSKDPEAERLWSLMAQPSPPEPVYAWIWGAAQARLKEQFGESFDPQDHDAESIFRSLLREISVALFSEKKEDKKLAENILRIVICWLVEKRSLKTWQVAEQLPLVLFKDLKEATKVAQRAVQKGRPGELRIAAAMAALGDQMVKAAEDERTRERNISNDLRYRLDDANRKIEMLRTDLADAKTIISERDTAIAKLEQTLAAERHHWGHDLTETKAEQKVLLGERLGPLLSDAIDALEIDPPAPGTALRRVKAALSVIEEAKE